MAAITLTFNRPLPEGVQVGDIAWYLDVSEGVEVQMGPIIIISETPVTGTPVTMIINGAAGVNPPTTADFIFYVKDPIAKVGQLKGYYAEVQFRNNSTKYAELYSVGSEIFESSK